MIMGRHTIKTWSTTQSVTALSSGEAEYYGIVKGGSQGIGLRSMMGELGVEVDLRVMTDASAALGISTRRGLGKVRHIEVSKLWIQEKVSDGTMRILSTKTDSNKADVLTKHVDSMRLKYHIESAGAVLRPGRHPLAPSVIGGYN